MSSRTKDHFAVGAGARLVITRHQAVDAGVGAPVATLGLSLWSDYQLSTDLGFVGERLRDTEIYAGVGGQFGFLGPSYCARKSNAFLPGAAFGLGYYF